jgi:hypothetical protein
MNEFTKTIEEIKRAWIPRVGNWTTRVTRRTEGEVPMGRGENIRRHEMRYEVCVGADQEQTRASI